MYLGVDGGGTKTALCLLREDGRIATQARASSCYYFTEGIDLVGRVLRQGIDEVCEMASWTPPGSSWSSDRTKVFQSRPSADQWRLAKSQVPGERRTEEMSSTSWIPYAALPKKRPPSRTRLPTLPAGAR